MLTLSLKDNNETNQDETISEKIEEIKQDGSIKKDEVNQMFAVVCFSEIVHPSTI